MDEMSKIKYHYYLHKITSRVAHKTEDPKLKELYLKDLTEDHSECCKTKYRRKEKLEAKRKETEAKRSAVAAVSKLPPTIQVIKIVKNIALSIIV